MHATGNSRVVSSLYVIVNYITVFFYFSHYLLFLFYLFDCSSMEALILHRLPLSSSLSSLPSLKPKTLHRNPNFRLCCSSTQSETIEEGKLEYKPGMFDGLFLSFFRHKMVEEVGWDSEKPGYDGLIEVVNRLMMKGRTNLETEEAAVRVLRSLFPPFLLELFQLLIAPLGEGKVAAMMVARATALSCQWLMGPCAVNSVDLPDGSSCQSGVLVQKCKYLEESKCVGICINTCKLPTQTFFNEHMGVPLLMEPNFTDYSCQFKFGVSPPPSADDKALHEPCLDICPNVARRRRLSGKNNVDQCPKV
ncbi:hypothetical protein QJS04_geneDACA007057 [Acorus gramineus]|uniref:Beta-carotene isomerase D27-like C-terminal domain-containing protein n=1 Tax=Acorus gramineus TaxID=55184 RepID=A0AAV9BMN4_ACOGR|nr:hypothetical protein QJS04_geneDACA007057 [Acorus gramineus]